jgi:rRNA maturation endonuclease Nob1
MPTFVRCKHCGKDYPYRADIETKECDNCAAPLKAENVRYFAVPGSTKQADPLGEF